MKIAVDIEGVVVASEVVKLTPRLITIRLGKAFGELESSMGVPMALGVSPQVVFEDEKGLTDEGRKTAERLTRDAVKVATIFKKDRAELKTAKAKFSDMAKNGSRKGRFGPPTEHSLMSAHFKKKYKIALPIDMYEQLMASL